MKYCYDFNTVGVRDNNINDGKLVAECPRCREDETQEHIILCKENRVSQVEFIYTLEQKLLRVESNNVFLEEIAMIINDIRIYLIQ